MGKIFDAMERRKRDKVINIDRHNKKLPEILLNRDRETEFAKRFCTLNDCSPNLVVLSAPESVETENFKVLRTKILFSRDRERPRTILITSAFPQEGKTFVASNLAVSIALGIDEHVLLVDCDLRRPSLDRMFGYENAEGLHEFLIGQRQLPDLLLRTEIEKLSLLPAGDIPPNPSELLSSSAMEAFLQEIRERYQDRIILLDSAPSQITAEPKILSKYVDGIILVIRNQKASRHAVKKTVHDLGSDKILGVVYNAYDRAAKAYKSYYRSYYK